MDKLRVWIPWDYVGLIAALITLIVLFSLQSQHFFSLITFTTIANQIPTLTVIAVGMTFVLIIAGIDLSVGSVMALSGSVFAVAMLDGNMPLWIACLCGLSAGLCCGMINGSISVAWRIPSFIVTLGMLEVARGGAYLSTDSQTKYLGTQVELISTPITSLGLSPSLLLSIVVVIVAQLILRRTIAGRYVIAIGSNEEAARLSGINIKRWKFIVFALSGLLAGLGGIFHVGYLQSADPNAGSGLELAAIAAVVIGGTRLSGGKGSVYSTFLGVLIISVLQTGLAQIGVSEPGKRIITGTVIIGAVILDAWRNQDGGLSHYFKNIFSR